MNKVIEIGRLTKDVEVKYTQAGKAFCMFGLAVDDGFGEQKKTYFFNVVVWGKAAESCANILHKGSKVAVSGKLTSRQYDNKNGQKVTAVEIVADMYGGVEFLDPKGQTQQSQPAQTPLMDEEIPF